MGFNSAFKGLSEGQKFFLWKTHSFGV